jgi:hypothetical protein
MRAAPALFRHTHGRSNMIKKLLFAVGIGYLFRRFTGSRSRRAGTTARY